MRHVAIIAITIAVSSMCSAQNYGALSLDIEYWHFDESFEHETHPDDQAFLTGPAGKTELKDTCAVALKYELPIIDVNNGPYFSLSGGGLIIGNAEEKRKNINDPRPTGQHSEIYSRIDPGIGPLVGLDLGWKFNNIFYVGVSVDTAWLRVEHGWNRFGRYQTDDSEFKGFFSLGPEARFFFGDRWNIFGGYNFGNASQGRIGLEFRF